MLADRTGDARLAQVRCTVCVYVCMCVCVYVWNLLVSSDLLLLLLFIFWAIKVKKIGPSSLINVDALFYLVSYHL